MASKDYTPYQQEVIRRHYERQPQKLQQRLAELVTNLFLARGKKRQQLWATAGDLMHKLGVPESRVQHLLKKGDPALLAEVVKELESRR